MKSALVRACRLLAVFLFTLAGANAALAFSAGPGFAAATFATGLGSGTPAGVAFVGPAMYAVSPSDGYLYRSVGGVTSLVAFIDNIPTGITASGGFLYIARSGAPSDVVRVDPATGAILATPAGPAELAGFRARAVAADAATGDLFVTTEPAYIWRIQSPSSSGAAMPAARRSAFTRSSGARSGPSRSSPATITVGRASRGSPTR